MSISSALLVANNPPLYFRLTDIYNGMTELPFYTYRGAYHGKVVLKNKKWSFVNATKRQLSSRSLTSTLTKWDSDSIFQASLIAIHVNF